MDFVGAGHGERQVCGFYPVKNTLCRGPKLDVRSATHYSKKLQAAICTLDAVEIE
jgi:hypothetical protein